ncbi:hypothetical protein QA584_16990 [Anaerocolumna sp. AGMB13025]|uniref:DUF6199 family natural product biosynthesis protein n=1 Tax=Anaerocolumna sp. AGMB13025 TaxID=3039116 RepID=UPI00241F614C|nr:DUF6199 family natural product biosynthesis protein [Anaerocolumna sp. AGMB13025]WFR55296.1 hypothetical protein QA584_16990 [Anaerocolumna sp. AGMB13025]
MWLFVIIFVIFGMIGTLSPRTSWYLSNWWRFENKTDPSKASLFIYRISGIIFLLAALLIIFV